MHYWQERTDTALEKEVPKITKKQNFYTIQQFHLQVYTAKRNESRVFINLFSYEHYWHQTKQKQFIAPIFKIAYNWNPNTSARMQINNYAIFRAGQCLTIKTKNQGIHAWMAITSQTGFTRNPRRAKQWEPQSPSVAVKVKKKF